MGRSSEYGKGTSTSMYEREHLRSMARKLGLRLLKFDHARSKGQDQPTNDGSQRDSETRKPRPAFSMEEQAS